MNKKIVIFNGQGTQFENMQENIQNTEDFKNFLNSFKTTKIDLEKLFFDPNVDIHEMINTQVAITLYNIYIFECSNIQAESFAGLSLGEYSALYFGKVLDKENLIPIIEHRAKFMQENIGDNQGMVALMNISQEIIKPLFENKEVYFANFNSPNQIVIAGNQEDLNQVVEQLKAQKYRKIFPLKVKGAFHTPLMKKAEIEFAKYLETININKLTNINVYSNVFADKYTSENNIKENLAKHLISSVKFEQMIEKIKLDGYTEFVEVGPKLALTKILKDANIAQEKIIGIIN